VAVSAELASWIQLYFDGAAKEAIGKSESISRAVTDFRDSLGGAAKRDDFQGWLTSQYQSVTEAATLATKGKSEPVSESASKSAPEPLREIPDEVYEELAKALAEDLNAEIAAADEAYFNLIMDSEKGLWAQVRAGITAEIKEQGLGAAGKAGLFDSLHDSAWKAMTEAFDGLYEAMLSAGGYEWLLTREES
jgi:hypothetical protein